MDTRGDVVYVKFVEGVSLSQVDLQASDWWGQNFKDPKVHVDDFETALTAWLKRDSQGIAPPSFVTHVIVSFLIDTMVESDKFITREEFAIFLSRFGPFSLAVDRAVKSLFKDGMIFDWFWGHPNESSDFEGELHDAEAAVLANPGSFVVCFDPDRTDAFILLFTQRTDPILTRIVLVRGSSESGEATPTTWGHSVATAVQKLLPPNVLPLPGGTPLYQKIKRERELFDGASAQLQPNGLSILLRGMADQLEDFFDIVRRFFSEQMEGTYTRHYVHWYRLNSELSQWIKMFSKGGAKEGVLMELERQRNVDKEKKIIARVNDLTETIREAQQGWMEMMRNVEGRSPQRSRKQAAKDEIMNSEKRVMDWEMAIYQAFAEFLAELREPRLFDVATSVEGKSLRPSDEHGKGHMTARKLFWYRFFGVRRQDIPRRMFAEALFIHLRQEYNQELPDQATFEKVIFATMDIDSDGNISPSEWHDFVYRFGPLNECFRKCKAVCQLTPEVAPACWFTHCTRDQAAAMLRKNQKTETSESTVTPMFVIRPGHTENDHAFSFSILRGEGKQRKLISTRIRVVTTPGARFYVMEGDTQQFPDLYELVDRALRQLGSGWQGQRAMVASIRRQWDELQEEPPATVINWTEQLKSFFGISSKEIPKSDQWSYNLQAMEASIKKGFADAKAYLEENRAISSSMTLPTSRRMLGDVLVAQALEDEKWEALLQLLDYNAVADRSVAHIKFAITEGAHRVWQLRPDDSAASKRLEKQRRAVIRRVNSVIYALFGLIRLTKLDFYELITTAVDSFNFSALDLLLKTPFAQQNALVEPSQSLTGPSGRPRNIFHHIADINIDIVEEEEEEVKVETAYDVLKDSNRDRRPPDAAAQEFPNYNQKKEAVESMTSLLIRHVHRTWERLGQETRERAQSLGNEQASAEDPQPPSYPSMDSYTRNFTRNRWIVHDAENAKFLETDRKDLRPLEWYMETRVERARRTPALIAAYNKNKILEVFIREGRAKCDAFDVEDKTILHYLCSDIQIWSYGELKHLFDLDARNHAMLVPPQDPSFHNVINAKNNNGLSPLSILLQKQADELHVTHGRRENYILWLLKNGATLDSLEGSHGHEEREIGDSTIPVTLTNMLLKHMRFADAVIVRPAIGGSGGASGPRASVVITTPRGHSKALKVFDAAEGLKSRGAASPTNAHQESKESKQRKEQKETNVPTSPRASDGRGMGEAAANDDAYDPSDFDYGGPRWYVPLYAVRNGDYALLLRLLSQKEVLIFTQHPDPARHEALLHHAVTCKARRGEVVQLLLNYNPSLDQIKANLTKLEETIRDITVPHVTPAASSVSAAAAAATSAYPAKMTVSDVAPRGAAEGSAAGARRGDSTAAAIGRGGGMLAPLSIGIDGGGGGSVVGGGQYSLQVFGRAIRMDVNAVDDKLRTALHLSAKIPEGDTTLEDRVISEHLMAKLDLARRDMYGMTALHYACKLGRLSFVELLIQKHTGLNVRTSLPGMGDEDAGVETSVVLSETQPVRPAAVPSAASGVASQGDGGVAQQPPSRQDSIWGDELAEVPASQTPLHFAAGGGHWQIISALIKAGAEIDFLDVNGQTPLAVAMLRRMKIVEEIKEAKIESKRKQRLWEFAQIHYDPGVEQELLELANIPAERRAGQGKEVLAAPDLRQKLLASDESDRGLSKAGTSSRVDTSGKSPKDIELQSMRRADKDEVKDGRSRGDIRIGEYDEDPAPRMNSELERLKLLKHDLDQTINLLLDSGAKIEIATESCSKELTDLLDVGDQWRQIQTKIQNAEQNIIEARRSTESEVESKQIEQHKLGVFSDKSNQIVIDYVYRTMVQRRHGARLFLYTFFLLLLTILGIMESTRDKFSAFFIGEGLTQTLVDDEFDVTIYALRRTFREIDSKDEFWQWCRGPFMENLYPRFDSETSKDPEFPRYWKDNQEVLRGGFLGDNNIVIGAPRLRQQRSRFKSCGLLHTSDFDSVTGACFEETGFGKGATEPFGPSLEYTYQSQEELDGSYHWGNVDFYDGSGYVVSLPSLANPDRTPRSGAHNDTLNRFLQLEEDNWIDARTRVVFVEFVLFNAMEHHFVVATLTLEFPIVGGIVVAWDFRVTRLKHYATDYDIAVAVLEIWFILVVLYQLGRMIHQNLGLGGVIFSDLYSFILSVIIVLLVLTIVFLRITALVQEQDVDWTAVEGFPRVIRLARITSVETDLISILVLFAWFQLLPVLSVFRKLRTTHLGLELAPSRLIIMIQMMARELLTFAALLVIVLVAFNAAEYIAYGYRDPGSYTFVFGFITRFSLAFAGRDILLPNHENHNNKFLGTVYPLLFVIIVSLLLLNLLIAILTSAYQAASQQAGDAYWAGWEYDMIVWQHAVATKDSKALETAVIETGNFLTRMVSKLFKSLRLLCPCCVDRRRAHRENMIPWEPYETASERSERLASENPLAE